MSKEIIGKLLEEISERCSIIESNAVNHNVMEQIHRLTGYRQGVGRNDGSGIVDQALSLYKQQPTATAGDFTKRIRTQPYDPKWKHTLIIQTEDRDELCDRLDRAEAINKDLLGLCEEFMVIADDGSARFDDPQPGSIYLRAEAVIAKAKDLRDSIKNPPPQADT